ncbi:hypothetical protein MTO96_021630 [Rhipicephalus appendiculatus]
MQVTLIEKPVLSVQCNWNEALRERNGDAWVTCKSRGQPGIHGKLKRTGSSADGTPMVSTTDKFRVTGITKDTINVSHTDPNCQTCFIAPTTAFANVHNKSVACLDVTKGHLGVSASGTSEIRIWDSRTGEVRRDLEGHVWDVYTCRFFPSGVVVLSGGADMQLKIWSAETGKCPVTLKGHSASSGILELAFWIPKVLQFCCREVVVCWFTTGSLMGHFRPFTTPALWNKVVMSSQSARTALPGSGTVASLPAWAPSPTPCTTALTAAPSDPAAINLGTRDGQASEREVATDGKLLVVGTESGKLRGVGVHSRKTVFELDHPAAINCCCFLGQNRFLFGTQDGNVSVIDVRQTREPSITWKNSSSPVLCLLPYKQGFMVGRADGSCNFEALVGAESFSLTGPDCEPVYRVAYDGESFYTACRDGLIRKYRVPKS